LRQRGYTGKVVVGGPGISRHENAAELMLSRKLIDYFVTGDGEISFERIIKGELPYPGVNNRNPLPIDDLDSLPLPNFTGFDISRYPKVADRFTLSVEGSRGCVRDCTFCDIKMLFKKYRYKTGKRIFDEIMQIKEKHDVKTIWFTDSLVNGNQKEFRHFLSLLAAYNNDVSEQDKIGWTGQYIIRPKSQYTDEDFKLLKDSGCYTLATGLESYSEQVRHHLGKNFNNDDIRYYLEKCQEYDIKNFIMFIVGYPTETEDDFQKTLSFFEEYAHLADDNTITGVQLGHTMIWIPGAPISEMEKDLEIEFDDLRSVPAYNRWRNKNSDIRTRVMRRLKTQLHAMKHGFQVRHDEHHLRMFNRWLHG
jgi:radical SAM superfamily enzyme YgiQ (UPF0313 family)